MTAALEAVRERLEADGDQLHRVFLNLARNAVEAGAHRLRFAAVLASPRGFEPCPFKTQQEPFAFA